MMIQRVLTKFLKVFLFLQLISAVMVYLFMTIWDGPVSIGFPLGYYKVSCGMVKSFGGLNNLCDYGFKPARFVIDVVIILLIVVLINGKKTKAKEIKNK